MVVYLNLQIMALMYAYLTPSQDPHDPELSCGQDVLASFDQEYPELANKPLSEVVKEKKAKKNKSSLSKIKHEERKKIHKHATATCYVKSKSEENGRRLIKIKIYDLKDSPEICDNTNDGAVISAQYVVVDPYDDIMDQTECLVNRISKNLCGNSI